MLDFETSNSIKFAENYFFLENYVTSEGGVSHNVLYHQPLPITHYQVKFYVNNYFELLPIVSTAFKHFLNKKQSQQIGEKQEKRRLTIMFILSVCECLAPFQNTDPEV